MITQNPLPMNHQDALVILLDESNAIIGSKPRKDIDKVHDVFWCADVLVFDTGHQLLLSKIPEGNLYSGLWATTTATLLREGETADIAALRSLKKELNIEGVTPTELGEHFFVYPDGVKRRKTTYFCTIDHAPMPNPADIAELRAWNRADLESAIASTPELFAPTFLGIWEQYSSKLPF